MGHVVEWRNKHREGLRTPGFTTDEQQAAFYRDVICNPTSPHRYWCVLGRGGQFQAMVGLTYISWENGSAEISLITDGRGGVGQKAVRLVLEEAFYRMRLLTVYGEVYHANPAKEFWDKMVAGFHGAAVILPRRKFWDGHLHDSTYFYFKREDW